ncbi:hypothetical protein [Rhizobium binae]|uniref:hypothetical protein n=1 Tax=Rhizobium binae TaxID=1138190 RepID=UPI003CCFF35D
MKHAELTKKAQANGMLALTILSLGLLATAVTSAANADDLELMKYGGQGWKTRRPRQRHPDGRRR